MQAPELLKRLPATPRRRRFPWLLAAALAAGLVATVSLQPATIVARSARVSVHRVQVVPTVAGLVTAVAVSPGDRVTRGEVLATLDDAEAQAMLQQAEAHLALAQGPARAAAEADCHLAQLQLAAHVLRAPRAGTVARCDAEPGDYAPAGTAIATLVTDTPPWITAHVDERDATALRLGATAHVSLTAFPGRTWQGRVSRIGRLAKAKKSHGGPTLPVRITLEGLPAGALPGMSAAVSIDR